MNPATIGRIVLYRLSEADVNYLQIRRYAEMQEASTRVMPPYHEPLAAHVGEQFPAVIVRSRSDFPNLHVLLDGPDSLWVVKVSQGDRNGMWSWPPRPDLKPPVPAVAQTLPPTDLPPSVGARL